MNKFKILFYNKKTFIYKIIFYTLITIFFSVSMSFLNLKIGVENIITYQVFRYIGMFLMFMGIILFLFELITYPNRKNYIKHKETLEKINVQNKYILSLELVSNLIYSLIGLALGLTISIFIKSTIFNLIFKIENIKNFYTLIEFIFPLVVVIFSIAVSIYSTLYDKINKIYNSLVISLILAVLSLFIFLIMGRSLILIILFFITSGFLLINIVYELISVFNRTFNQRFKNRFSKILKSFTSKSSILYYLIISFFMFVISIFFTESILIYRNNKSFYKFDYSLSSNISESSTILASDKRESFLYIKNINIIKFKNHQYEIISTDISYINQYFDISFIEKSSTSYINSIILPEYFKTRYKYKIDDQIMFTFNDIKLSFFISGFIENTNYPIIFTNKSFGLEDSSSLLINTSLSFDSLSSILNNSSLKGNKESIKKFDSFNNYKLASNIILCIIFITLSIVSYFEIKKEYLENKKNEILKILKIGVHFDELNKAIYFTNFIMFTLSFIFESLILYSSFSIFFKKFSAIFKINIYNLYISTYILCLLVTYILFNILMFIDYSVNLTRRIYEEN